MLNESDDLLKHKFNKVIRVAKRFMRHVQFVEEHIPNEKEPSEVISYLLSYTSKFISHSDRKFISHSGQNKC